MLAAYRRQIPDQVPVSPELWYDYSVSIDPDCTWQDICFGKYPLSYDSLVTDYWHKLYDMGVEVMLVPFADQTSPRSNLPEVNKEGITYRAYCYKYGCYGILTNVAGNRQEPDEIMKSRAFGGWCGVFGPSGEVLNFSRKDGNDEQMVIEYLDSGKLKGARDCEYFIPTLTRAEVYQKSKND